MATKRGADPAVWVIAVCSVATIAGLAAADEQQPPKKARTESKKAPLEVPGNVQLQPDVVYGKGGSRDLKLDLFLPKDGPRPRPAIVFIHGGGWSGGTRTQFHPQAAHLASQGFVGACIEYRLSGEAKFPAAVEDSKCAVRWLRANAEKLGVDPNRIAACGGSAGGHLVAMLGTMNRDDGLEGEGGHAGFSSKVNLVIDFNGVADLTAIGGSPKNNAAGPVARFLGASFDEKPELYRRASPVTYIDKSDPPFLFLHGTGDTTVPFAQSSEFAKKLQAAAVPAEMYAAEGAAHGFFNRPPHYEPALKRMEEFLRKWFAFRSPGSSN